MFSVSFLVNLKISFFLVDIIKPKPLPRNVNGNFVQTNNNSNNNYNSTMQINAIDSSVNPSSNVTRKSSTSESTASTPIKQNSSYIPSPAANSVSSTLSKTESLIQRFSFNISNKSPPEATKRIGSKQIASIFEVRIVLTFS